MSAEIPEGRVGNLNAEHEKVLKEFWEKFLSLDDKTAGALTVHATNAEKDLESKPKTAADLHSAYWALTVREHPDAVLLRYLRARSWNIEKAFAMFTTALVWRLSFGCDKIAQDGEPVYNEGLEGFVSQMKSGKAYLHGSDKLNRPVFYIHVKLHSPKAQPASSLEKFTVYSLETGRRFLQPPLGQTCLVFDLTSFGLKNMDWSFIMFLTKSFEAYYPETLGLVCVHNAPWVFWGIWKVLSPLLDPVVRSKIAFTQSAKDLKEHIPAGHIPKSMGGDEDWAWSYTDPTPDSTAAFNDKEGKATKLAALEATRAELISITQEWAKTGAAPELEAKRNAILLKTKIAGIEADPYIYPKSVYAVQGNLHDNGTVTWNYKSDSPADNFGVPLDTLKAEASASA